MEISERSYLLSKINQLSAKRQKHEKIIQKLLCDQEYSTQRSPNSSRTSQIRIAKLASKVSNNKQDQNYAQQTARSNLSCLSNLSRQVNLDVYLTKKPQTPSSSCSSFNQNNLQSSLQDIYGPVRFILSPNQAMVKKSSLLSEDLIDFEIISNYLQKNQLWEEIFTKKEDGYYAFICPEINLHLQDTIHLSKQKVSQKQLQLIVQLKNEEKSYYEELQSENQEKEQRAIFIGLLSYLGTGFAPEIFHSLFGYSYKVFNVHRTEQYYQFTQIIKKMDEGNKIIFIGQSSLNRRMQELELQNLIQLSLKQLLKKFNKIIVINEIDNLCSKTLDVIHRRNHHSVIDLQNNEDVQIELFVSFVADKPNEIKRQHKITSSYSSKCSISHSWCDRLYSNSLFRFCLVNQAGQIVNYSSPYHNNKQNLTIKLSKKSEYKLYVSQLSVNQQIQPDLSSFSIMIQSRLPLGNILAEIKFNQSYNIMTETLANKYLRDFANIDEVQKEMIRLSQINPDDDLLIVRAHIKFMGLVSDFISIKEHTRKKGRKLYVQYEEKEVLIDKLYRQNRKRLTIAEPEIYQIYLSKKSAIKSCSGFSYSFAQISL